MALTYGQVAALTHDYIMPKVPDNIYTSNALIRRLTRPGKIRLLDGGNQINQPLNYQKASVGGWYDDLDTLSTDRSDDITSATFAWRFLHEPIRISRKDVLLNSGKQAVVNLVMAKTKIGQRAVKDNLGVALFSDGTAGTGAGTTDQLTGLQATISTSTTYGGIAVADFNNWVAQVKNNSGTDRALSLALVQQTIGAATEDNEKPSVGVMKQNVYDELWNIAQPYQRLSSENSRSLGFDDAIMINGVPHIVDSHMKAQSIFYLNEEHLFLSVHKDENLRIEKFDKLESTNSMLWRIFWAGNLTCANRRFQAELGDIQVAS